MSLGFYDRITRTLSVLPVIVLVTLANVFIAFSTAGVVLVQLLAAGINKHLSLGVALLVAIGVHTHIVFYHKIRNFIKTRSQQ